MFSFTTFSTKTPTNLQNQITTCIKGVIIKLFNEMVKISRLYVCRMELEADLGVLKNQIILHNSLVYGTAVCF